VAAIKWNVQEVAKRHGIESAPQLARAAGIAPGTATGLWYSRQLRVDVPTLQRICDLLQCSPGDVLIREETGDTRQTASVAA
jgi:DNA-binding Xre family transcriptional regulator